MMKKIMFFSILVLMSKPAFAYIDPGIGSMFIQGIIAALMLVPFYWRKLVGYIKSLFKKDTSTDEKKGTIDD